VAARFFYLGRLPVGAGNRPEIAEPFVHLDELVAELTEPMEGLHFPAQLGQGRPRPELAGLGLALELAGEGEVGAMPGVPAGFAAARALPTLEVLLHDAPPAHIPEGSDLLQNRRPLPLQRL
jgi:hypothetical protein